MDQFSRIISSFSMYKFLVDLTKPFTQMAAYRTGVIDARGYQIVLDEDMSSLQKNSFNDFDRLVVSLKRIIALVPDPYVRAHMSSPVTAVKLMSEECEKLGGDPDYFTLLAARELLACQYIDEEAAAAIANSVGGGGISGFKPEEIGVPVEAQKRYTKRNRIRRRSAPVMEDLENRVAVTQAETARKYPTTGFKARQWPGFLGKQSLEALKFYVTSGRGAKLPPSSQTSSASSPMVVKRPAPITVPGVPQAKQVRTVQTIPPPQLEAPPKSIPQPQTDKLLPAARSLPLLPYIPIAGEISYGKSRKKYRSSIENIAKWAMDRRKKKISLGSSRVSVFPDVPIKPKNPTETPSAHPLTLFPTDSAADNKPKQPSKPRSPKPKKPKQEPGLFDT